MATAKMHAQALAETVIVWCAVGIAIFWQSELLSHIVIYRAKANSPAIVYHGLPVPCTSCDARR